MRRSAAVLLLALLAGPASALKTEKLSSVGSGVTASAQPIEVVSGRALVRFDVSLSSTQRATRLSSVGAFYVKEVSGTPWTFVELPAAIPVGPGLTLLAGVPGVIETAPDHAYRANKVPNDALVNSQYALAQVSAFAGWEYETGASNRVTIAVVDTGINKAHPDLVAKFTNTTNAFCDPGPTFSSVVNDDTVCSTVPATKDTDACGHGTEVAGVAAASTNNGSSMAGMSWGAQLVALKIFADADCVPGCSNGGCNTDDFAIANAIDYARTALQGQPLYGNVVVNLSVGGPGACPAVVQTAVNLAVAAGVVIVAASGNNSPNPCPIGSVTAPANCVGVIPAGATTSANQIAGFSCGGPELAANGVAAPGEAVLTTANGGGTAAPSGTSFSSPMVAGLAALVYSQKPTFTPAQIKNAIRGGAETVGASANFQGAGRINAYRTLRLAVNGTLAGFDGEQKPIAFPNPFKPSVTGAVNFAIPPGLQGGQLTIKIFTLDGTLVRSVNSQSWNGKNTEGTPVASGTYVFVVTTSAGTGRGRLSVLR